ncbi:hypothetical protein P171DRAFT_286172 [Karstenula rhodostoma CBS 690.94]|uniref:Uncharacterized protein n=1 Tax=Karstenula rhodostoma CBS 690.94 TaxID=1392251 RepID=A0A9P4PKL9_9PLEO|nr:hypothetical protein P171DRAFT_286172 [Karstenula rhodostoma CBS 690.94]
MPLPPGYSYKGFNGNRGKLAPAEYVRNYHTGVKGWEQGGVRRRKVKPYYHLVWPKDKDRGNLGRFKDILQGKGPDIHLSISAQKHDYMVNRPLRGRWSNWERLDPRLSGPNPWPGQYNALKAPCWVGDASKKYNFHTRKYEDFHHGMWTDAIWQGPNKNSDWPDQYRDVYGVWRQDRHWQPRAPGQKMKNI